MAKAYLFSFKFDSIIQDIREGEGSNLADSDSAETTLITYKLNENGTLSSPDVKIIFYLKTKNLFYFIFRLEKINQSNLKLVNIKMAK